LLVRMKPVVFSSNAIGDGGLMQARCGQAGLSLARFVSDAAERRGDRAVKSPRTAHEPREGFGKANTLSEPDAALSMPPCKTCTRRKARPPGCDTTIGD
jgi:hypothetical protein